MASSQRRGSLSVGLQQEGGRYCMRKWAAAMMYSYTSNVISPKGFDKNRNSYVPCATNSTMFINIQISCNI